VTQDVPATVELSVISGSISDQASLPKQTQTFAVVIYNDVGKMTTVKVANLLIVRVERLVRSGCSGYIAIECDVYAVYLGRRFPFVFIRSCKEYFVFARNRQPAVV